MSATLHSFVESCKKWLPPGPAKRLVLGWLLINSSAICLFSSFDSRPPLYFLADLIPAAITVISGKPWLMNWIELWRFLPLLLPLAVIPALVWLRKPTIFTAAILAVAGMFTGPGSKFFLHDGYMLGCTLAFAIFF